MCIRDRYNAKKTKTRDKIPDYYRHIEKSKQERLFHEVIFQTVSYTTLDVYKRQAQITSLERQLRPSIQKRLKEAQELSDLKLYLIHI